MTSPYLANHIVLPRKIPGHVFRSAQPDRLIFRPGDPSEKAGTFKPGECRVAHDKDYWQAPEAFTAQVKAAGEPGVAVMMDEPEKQSDGSFGNSLTHKEPSGRQQGVFVRDWRPFGGGPMNTVDKRPARGPSPGAIGTIGTGGNIGTF